MAPFAVAALEGAPEQAEPKLIVGKPPGPKKVVRKARITILIDLSAQRSESLTWLVAGDWP